MQLHKSVRMGLASSKTVELKMPSKSEILRRTQRQHLALTHTTPSNQLAVGHTRSRHTVKYEYKALATSTPRRKPKVLVVTLDDEDLDNEFPVNFVRRRRDDGDNLVDLSKLSEDFSEFETLANLPDEDCATRRKLRRFVVAWRNGLSYPHTKKGKTPVGIPIAATSVCRKGISRWQRCRRSCLRCSSRSASDQLDDNLLHKDSLNEFVVNTQHMGLVTFSASSVNINMQESMIRESILGNFQSLSVPNNKAMPNASLSLIEHVKEIPFDDNFAERSLKDRRNMIMQQDHHNEAEFAVGRSHTP